MHTEHCQEEKGKTGTKTQLQNTFDFKARTEESWSYSACANKEKLMIDIDTDKLALISD